jgi:hypothetical protein
MVRKIEMATKMLLALLAILFALTHTTNDTHFLIAERTWRLGHFIQIWVMSGTSYSTGLRYKSNISSRVSVRQST